MCSAHIVLLLTFILNDLTMYLAFLGQWDMLWTGAVPCLAFYMKIMRKIYFAKDADDENKIFFVQQFIYITKSVTLVLSVFCRRRYHGEINIEDQIYVYEFVDGKINIEDLRQRPQAERVNHMFHPFPDSVDKDTLLTWHQVSLDDRNMTRIMSCNGMLIRVKCQPCPQERSGSVWATVITFTRDSF